MLLYFVAGTMGGMIRTGDPAQGGSHSVYLLPGPIHTDLILPMTSEARALFGFLPDDGIPLQDWLIVGWGARDFYTTTGTYRDVEVGAVLKAVSGDSAVMRVQPIGPFSEDDRLTRLELSAAQFEGLLRAVRAGFADPPARLPVPGLTGEDHFYEGTGRFTLFRTCNVWVGEVLRAAGVRAGVWTPFTWSLPSGALGG